MQYYYFIFLLASLFSYYVAILCLSHSYEVYLKSNKSNIDSQYLIILYKQYKYYSIDFNWNNINNLATRFE